jgi:hypothetical protein
MRLDGGAWLWWRLARIGRRWLLCLSRSGLLMPSGIEQAIALKENRSRSNKMRDAGKTASDYPLRYANDVTNTIPAPAFEVSGR